MSKGNVNTDSKVSPIRIPEYRIAIWLACLLAWPAFGARMPKGNVGKVVENPNPPTAFPVFSENPSMDEIEKARVFEEPLIAIGTPSAVEAKEFSQAINGFLHRGTGDDLSAMTHYLEKYPESPWKASLLCNMGIAYYNFGYFSLALNAWEEGWTISKSQTRKKEMALADRIAGELAKMNARLGRFERLEILLAEVEHRNYRGSVTERIQGAKEGLWMMKNHPEFAFRCGPSALERILALKGAKQGQSEILTRFPSTVNGVSLFELSELANSAELSFRIAKRKPGASIVVPSVVHWKVNHYAAIVGQSGGFYHIQDPTFGDDLWISQNALEHEASGYFLVPKQTLTNGWTPVEKSEARGIWGKGYVTASDPNANTPSDAQAGGGSGSNDCKGMPVYSFHLLLASLNIRDNPLGYTPLGIPSFT